MIRMTNNPVNAENLEVPFDSAVMPLLDDVAPVENSFTTFNSSKSGCSFCRCSQYFVFSQFS